MTIQILSGSLIAILIAWLAWRTHNLSTSGALAAVVIGAVVMGLGGWAWGVLLIGFFISASALSKLAGKRKSSLEAAFSKGSQRDAGQVIANGGICAAFVILHLIFPASVWVWMGFAGTLAVANADTWGTELGVLSKRMPRLITSLQKVPRGTAGAVTLTGTLASFGGSLFIGLLSVLVWPQSLRLSSLAAAAGMGLLVSICGLLGALSDSWMSATVQAMYFCPSCQQETEHAAQHACGTPTLYQRGWPWFNNDLVNLISTLIGGLLSLLAFALLA
jgi:uncharacterized protein (TIGR00297 family)